MIPVLLLQSCTILFEPIPQIPRHGFILEDVEIFQSSAKNAFDNKSEQTFMKGKDWLLKTT